MHLKEKLKWNLHIDTFWLGNRLMTKLPTIQFIRMKDGLILVFIAIIQMPRLLLMPTHCLERKRRDDAHCVQCHAAPNRQESEL